MQPTWAPAGRRMAFARTVITGQRTLLASIWVTGDRNSAPREVFTTNSLRPIYLYWSPDSEKLALLSQLLGSGELELGVLELDRDQYRTLDQGQPYYWSWLPDNSALVSHVGGDVRLNAAARLSLVPLDPLRRKADFTMPPASFQSPAVSPDGRYLAYVTTTARRHSLVAREIDGPDQPLLTEVPGFAYFAYAPRGNRHRGDEERHPGPLRRRPTGAHRHPQRPRDDAAPRRRDSLLLGAQRATHRLSGAGAARRRTGSGTGSDVCPRATPVLRRTARGRRARGQHVAGSAVPPQRRVPAPAPAILRPVPALDRRSGRPTAAS